MEKKISLVDQTRADYIDEYRENSKLINYTELTENDGLVTVLYKDLPNTVIEGFPIASDYLGADGKTYSMNDVENLSPEERAKCELRYYYLPYTHELCVGTTGSGKTTGCIEPQLRAISYQKNKPNLFVTDPKGELFDRNAKHLRKQGYNIYILNFKDLTRSHKWNPLLELYDTKMKLKTLGQSAVMHTGKVNKKLSLYANPSEYSKDGYIEYDGKAFPTPEMFDEYLTFERDIIEATVSDLVNQIACTLIRPQSMKDPTWEQGAQELLKGLILCMLDDAYNQPDVITRDRMNFATLQKYYLALKIPILDENSSITLYNHPLTKNKPTSYTAMMATSLANAYNTMRSYCGVFDSCMKDWFKAHLFSILSHNTISLDNSNKKPFAIFLITRDYEKSDFQVAGLFVDWVYRQMLERAEAGESNRALHFLLDEFGNIPEIKDLENKIATSRSRNIWFHLVVQSYKQIEAVYGDVRATVIRDNCNSQIFLGSQNRPTKQIFSDECGKHSVPTIMSKIVPNHYDIEEVPLVPVSRLELIKPGEIYIKRIYMPVITSQYIRSYVCAQQGTYKDFSGGLASCAPISLESFNSPRFICKDLDKYMKPSRRN